MGKNDSKIISVRVNAAAKARIDQIVARLREAPPVMELGAPSKGSIIAAAVVEGLEVLGARYGIPPEGPGWTETAENLDPPAKGPEAPEAA
jgi:hypothetical protein